VKDQKNKKFTEQHFLRIIFISFYKIILENMYILNKILICGITLHFCVRIIKFLWQNQKIFVLELSFLYEFFFIDPRSEKFLLLKEFVLKP
jgi:hypothetical protein